MTALDCRPEIDRLQQEADATVVDGSLSDSASIVCLGWGSLIWRPGSLPLEGGWRRDGPAMKVEFARKSNNGRITIVITEDTPALQVLWCRLAVRSLADAKAALAARECIPTNNIDRDIAFWSRTVSSAHSSVDALSGWAASAGHAGVVWTALPPKFPDTVGKPSSRQVVRYLSSLGGLARSEAEKYVRYTPAQIRTPYRDEIERELGWMPLTSSDNPFRRSILMDEQHASHRTPAMS